MDNYQPYLREILDIFLKDFYIPKGRVWVMDSALLRSGPPQTADDKGDVSTSDHIVFFLYESVSIVHMGAC